MQNILNNNDLINKLYNDHCQELRQYVASKFGLDAAESEDIVQITFVKFAKIAETLENQNSLRAYLFRIAYNCVIDEKRKKTMYSRHVSSSAAEGLEALESAEQLTSVDQTLNNPERIHGAQQQLTILQGAIQTMPNQRQK